MLLVAVTISPFESSLFTQLQALKLQPARPHPHRCPSQSDSWYAAYSKASHVFKIKQTYKKKWVKYRYRKYTTVAGNNVHK